MKLVATLPVLMLAFVVGCGDARGGDVATNADDFEALRALDRDLRAGDHGAAVRAVHAYLERYGYFPNESLAERYPAWRPYADAPLDRSVYDDNTTAAVTALQENLGLETSGIVDEKTRHLLLKPRCGVPDIRSQDPSNKWELDASSWNTDSLRWRVVSVGGGMSTAQVRTAAQQAFSQWANATEFQFTETSGTAEILIRFTADPPWGDWEDEMFGGTYVPVDGGDAYFNPSIPWSADPETPDDEVDLNSVMIHELGHALGILHTSWEDGVMYPTLDYGVQKRSLQEDDRIAAHAKNIRWTEFDNWSVDIDVGDGSLFHHTYVTGGASVPGGREVWALQNGSWFLYPGQGAVRIAGKGSANVWIVQDDHEIYQWVSGAWVRRSGCANDVAVAEDGQVWIVGCTTAPGGFNIHKWRGSSWGAAATGGIGGVRISLGKKKPVNPCHGICPIVPGQFDLVPWIVQDDGDIYRRDSKQVDSGSWEKLSGGASDIAASPAGYTWSLGENPVTGGYRIYVWNEQGSLDEGQPAPSELAKWVRVPGAALNIGTDSVGNPYIVNDSEHAFW